jgi:DNA-binding protein H-NS
MDLSNMSIKELRRLEEQVEVQLRITGKRERQAAIEQIYSIAHSLGMPLWELLGSKKLHQQSSDRYLFADPDEPSNRWTGKGPRPAWLRKKLEAGMRLDSFRVASA